MKGKRGRKEREGGKRGDGATPQQAFGKRMMMGAVLRKLTYSSLCTRLSCDLCAGFSRDYTGIAFFYLYNYMAYIHLRLSPRNII